MLEIIKEQLKEIIDNNEIFITVSKTVEDEYGNEYKEPQDIELREFIKNKSKYEEDYTNISYLNKLYFNEIQDIELGLAEKLDDYFYKLTDRKKFEEYEDEEGALSDYINTLVVEHMKLYDTKEIQDYLKELLKI